MWWISYRGECGHGVDNIGVFEDDGSPRKKHPLLLDTSPAAHPLHIARGFALVGDDLYIANAWLKDSHIARYRRHGDTFRFEEVLAKTEQVAAMVHPFDVELGDDGRIYVSCQDTNTVVSLVPKTRKTSHRWHRTSASTIPMGIFFPARWSRPAMGDFPSTVTTRFLDVPAPLGLRVVLDKRGKPRHSVRGIIVHKNHLYVADEAGDSVKVFNVKSGELMARITGRELKAPVHLILHNETLYIGASGTGSILALDLSTPPSGELKARVVIDEKLDAPSGFAIGPDGDLYVAERKKQRVRRFSPKGKKKGTFIDDLPDML